MAEFYRQEEVQQILQLAIARQVETEELSRTQLLEIADEMGISRDDLQLAEQEWLTSRGEAQERQAFNLYRREQFWQSTTKLLIFNAFVLILDLSTSGSITWARFFVLICGLVWSLNAWKTFRLKGESYEDAFQNWRRRRWLKRSVTSFLNRWVSAK